MLIKYTEFEKWWAVGGSQIKPEPWHKGCVEIARQAYEEGQSRTLEKVMKKAKLYAPELFINEVRKLMEE